MLVWLELRVHLFTPKSVVVQRLFFFLAAKDAVVGQVSCWRERSALTKVSVPSIDFRKQYEHCYPNFQRRNRRTSSLSCSRSAAPRLLDVAVHPTQFGDEILFSQSLGQTLMVALLSADGAWLPSCCVVRRWQGRKSVSGEEGWQWYT
jgi:hypothetical protein